MFKVGDSVIGVYEDNKGIILEIIERPSELQDVYLVKWEDGTQTWVAREEIY